MQLLCSRHKQDMGTSINFSNVTGTVKAMHLRVMLYPVGSWPQLALAQSGFERTPCWTSCLAGVRQTGASCYLSLQGHLINSRGGGPGQLSSSFLLCVGIEPVIKARVQKQWAAGANPCWVIGVQKGLMHELLQRISFPKALECMFMKLFWKRVSER